MCDTIHFLKKNNTKQHFCHKEELKYIERKKKQGLKRALQKMKGSFLSL